MGATKTSVGNTAATSGRARVATVGMACMAISVLFLLCTKEPTHNERICKRWFLISANLLDKFSGKFVTESGLPRPLGGTFPGRIVPPCDTSDMLQVSIEWWNPRKAGTKPAYVLDGRGAWSVLSRVSLHSGTIRFEEGEVPRIVVPFQYSIPKCDGGYLVGPELYRLLKVGMAYRMVGDSLIMTAPDSTAFLFRSRLGIPEASGTAK